MQGKNTREREERRRFKRIKKNLYVQCGPWKRPGIWSDVVIQDISKAGLSFSCRKEFRIGEMLEIRVTTFLRKQLISLIGRVVSCERKFIGTGWIARISITQISDEDAGIFQEIIQAFSQDSQK